MEIVAQAADPAAVTMHALTRFESRDVRQHPDSESITGQSAKKVPISAGISLFPQPRTHDGDG
jgi:hypothetical protein